MYSGCGFYAERPPSPERWNQRISRKEVNGIGNPMASDWTGLGADRRRDEEADGVFNVVDEILHGEATCGLRTTFPEDFQEDERSAEDKMEQGGQQKEERVKKSSKEAMQASSSSRSSSTKHSGTGYGRGKPSLPTIKAAMGRQTPEGERRSWKKIRSDTPRPSPTRGRDVHVHRGDSRSGERARQEKFVRFDTRPRESNRVPFHKRWENQRLYDNRRVGYGYDRYKEDKRKKGGKEEKRGAHKPQRSFRR